ncbi:MAG: class I SAM-dependent methyltransferase [Ignavibacteria bacterium]
MTKVDFDKYAEIYDEVLDEQLKFFDNNGEYFSEYKIKLVKNLIRTQPQQVLEYGCGVGRNIKHLATYFHDANVTGCDISERSLSIAKKNNPELDFFLITDEAIKSRKNIYNLIFISCVFHHIQPSTRQQTIDVIASLLKPEGELFIFEHNPFNPITRHIVNNCVWDRDAILLTPSETINLVTTAGLKLVRKNYTLFLPGFLNRLRSIEKYFAYLPIGGQYFVQAIKQK